MKSIGSLFFTLLLAACSTSKNSVERFIDGEIQQERIEQSADKSTSSYLIPTRKEASKAMFLASLCMDYDGMTNCETHRHIRRFKFRNFRCVSEAPKFPEIYALATCTFRGQMIWSNGRTESIPFNERSFAIRQSKVAIEERRWEMTGLYGNVR